ncbi:transposable element Tcb1 transposase [Trichonephila clavipes]|nr:transposable element Tcb1 transposase [Trichonephila clavipes]
MVRIVRHNDASVREGYIRNGGKEIKLFTSASKAFQCNNRIVMAQRKHLEDFLRGRIIRRSEELGIAQSVISRLWRRFQDYGNVSRCYSTGRSRVTTPNEDRYLAVTAKKKQTEYIIKPVSSALFSYRHESFKADRVQTLRVHWSICSAPGTHNHQENTIERHRYGGAEWLVWGGIILGSRNDMHVQSVTMTGHIYRDVILEQHVCWFRGTMGAEFLFMDDNARPQRANIVDECLQLEDITRMDCPAYSPDLNPIEHAWDMLGRRIAMNCSPSTPSHLSTGTSEGIA